MDLLPRTHHEFGNKEYWENFFRKQGKKSFEWYGEYTHLCGILSKYIKTADKVLVVGCGNSQLSSDMYDVGYHDIVNIDISSTVIQQMSERYSDSCPHMKFICMDLLELNFSDGSFSVVLDKGTLDAVFADDSFPITLKVEKMLKEIGRVLRIGGRYICVSLAQDYILRRVLKHFADEGWLVRVCRKPEVEVADSGNETRLPVFVFVFTKLHKLPNSMPILEISLFEDRIEKIETVEKLILTIQDIQRYVLIRHQLQKSSGLREQISLDLYGMSSSSPRYTVYVVDGQGSPRKKFAVFIVPQGRETEWLFCCDEGRKELQRNAGYERLLVVQLNGELEFSSLDEVKAELSEKVLELAPPNVQKQTPFLTLGDSINLRTICERGRSDISGEFVVEEVDRDGVIYRRLVFNGNRNMVQSEVRLVRDLSKSKKKGGKKNQTVNVDHDYLSSNYYNSVISGLAFVGNLQTALGSGLEILLLGLGGGPLAMYLRKNLPKVKVEAVEIDPAIVSTAKKWFNLTTDDQLVVHMTDGLKFVGEMNHYGHQKHVIILDVDNKDVSIGMSSPPDEFVKPAFLSKMHDALKPSGLLILNMLCRSFHKREEVIGNLKQIFLHIFGIKHHDDLNETLFCFPRSRENVPNLITDEGQKELLLSLRLLDETLQTQNKQSFATKLDNLKCL